VVQIFPLPLIFRSTSSSWPNNVEGTGVYRPYLPPRADLSDCGLLGSEDPQNVRFPAQDAHDAVMDRRTWRIDMFHDESSRKSVYLGLKGQRSRLWSTKPLSALVTVLTSVSIGKERKGKERKGKEAYLYSTFYIRCISQSAQAWITQFYLQIHHACLSFVCVHQMAPPLTEVRDI